MVYVVVRGLVLIRIPGCFAFVFRVGLYLDQVCFLHVSCDVIYRSNSEAIMCVLVVMFHMWVIHQPNVYLLKQGARKYHPLRYSSFLMIKASKVLDFFFK